MGRQGAERRHRRLGRHHGCRHRAVGCAALGRHGADRHAQSELVGPLHHVVHVLRGPVGRRPHHLVGAQGLWHRGLRRHLQGGRHELHRLHRGRHRHGGGRPRPAGAPVGAVRLLQPRQPAHVGHRGARNLPHPVLRVPVGPGAGRRGQGVPHRPARDLDRGARAPPCSCTR